MLKFQDRLYGTIELPELAREIAEVCPVILRLREVRMANIPFFTYPSFSNVDRYEHSLGVAHLAWRWACNNNLPKDLATALSIAALYHDGATPGFGHLFEEFLGRFGFDHERALVNLIMGRPDDLPGREYGQVFLGLQCKLRDILPSPSDPSSPLTPHAIANLAAGKGPLGRLIKGDIDFDNIDNVIRGGSAMGIISPKDWIHPYEVINALVYEDECIRLDRGHTYAMLSWAGIRRQLYTSILNNPHEFRAQAAIKWAIEVCASEDQDLSNQSAWRLTDPMLTFEHLRRNPFARKLIDRVRIGKPPELLFSAWVEDLSPLLGEGSSETIYAICQEVSALSNMEVYVNYYLDKRERSISLDVSKSTSLLASDVAEVINNGSTSQSGKSRSGIVGLIGVSRFERVAKESESFESKGNMSKRPISEDLAVEVLERILKQRLTTFSLGWIGTSRKHLRQQSLFALV
jgi:HD superfamily phosphohydrolase